MFCITSQLLQLFGITSQLLQLFCITPQLLQLLHWYYLAAAAAVLHYLAAAAVIDLVLVVAQVVGVPWCVEHQGQQKTKQLPRVEELQFRTLSDQKGTSLSDRTQSANKLKLSN